MFANVHSELSLESTALSVTNTLLELPEVSTALLSVTESNLLSFAFFLHCTIAYILVQPLGLFEVTL